MKTIKLQQLQENYKQYLEVSEEYLDNEEVLSFQEYVKSESENDPGFFAWFFDAEVDSFSSLTDDQQEEWNDFLNNFPE